MMSSGLWVGFFFFSYFTFDHSIYLDLEPSFICNRHCQWPVACIWCSSFYTIQPLLVFDTVTSLLVILPHFGTFFACGFANSCFVMMSFLPEVEGYGDEKGPKQCPSGSRWVLFSFFFLFFDTNQCLIIYIACI